MKKTLSTGLASLALLTFLTGCGQNVPAVVKSMSNENRCDVYNNRLLKVDQYIETVERTSAFHLEEAAVALENPQISTSNNKKDMLKDAKRRRAEILAELQTNGCERYNK